MVAVSAGVAQAKRSATLTPVRMTVPRRASSCAISVPSTSVSTTFTAQNSSERRRTSQK
jgi:hypothetical protein